MVDNILYTVLMRGTKVEKYQEHYYKWQLLIKCVPSFPYSAAQQDCAVALIQRPILLNRMDLISHYINTATCMDYAIALQSGSYISPSHPLFHSLSLSHSSSLFHSIYLMSLLLPLSLSFFSLFHTLFHVNLQFRKYRLQKVSFTNEYVISEMQK